MAMLDVKSDDQATELSRVVGESTVVRQMAELADAMTESKSESASMLRDIADCLVLMSQVWPSPTRSTNGGFNSSTPGISDELAETADLTRNQDRFEIRRLLGHGGFGVVLLAFDRRLGREVALKVPRPEVLVSRDMRHRFLREAQAAAALDHPNIVPVYDTGEIGPTWFITSRYVAGPTLAEWLQKQSVPVSSNDTCELVATLAEAVHHAHSRGVLHRDIKPANVLMEPTGEAADRELPFSPRLTDFGLARRLDDEEQFTKQGVLVGTPRYMAPEQAAGHYKEVGIQTDVYGLGVILYELLAGSPPHAGGSELDTLRRVLEHPVAIAPLRQRCVPRDLQTICLKCLEKQQARRYETAGALAADLRRFLAGEPVEARPVNSAGRLARWCRRRPWQASLSAALGLVSILGLAGITWQWLRAEQGLVLARNEATRAEDNLRHLELAFVDLAWMFEEGDLWTGSDETFPVLLRGKLHRYAEEMFPQYLANKQAPKPIRAAFHAITAKSQSLKGERQAAGENYLMSIELWRQVLQREPDNMEHSRAFAITLSGYHAHLVNSRQESNAPADFQVAQDMFQLLKLPLDDEIQARTVYAHLMTNVGYARASRGRHQYSIEAFDFARQMWHELTQRSPKSVYRVMEATMLSAIAVRQHRNAGDLPGALEKGQRARELMEEAVRLEPSRPDYMLLLASTLRDEAYFISRTENAFPAVAIYERSINVYREALQNRPVGSPNREAFGGINLELAQHLRETLGLESALPYYQTCAETWEALLAVGALSKESENRLAMVHFRIGDAHEELGNASEAVAAFRSSIGRATKLRDSPNASRKATSAFILSNIRLSSLLQRANELPEAIACARRAVVLLNEQTTNRPQNLNFRQQLRDAETKLRELETAAAVADSIVN
ncbi:MAG: serine/threonine-protein kinase [Pirellulales bacterium]